MGRAYYKLALKIFFFFFFAFLLFFLLGVFFPYKGCLIMTAIDFIQMKRFGLLRIFVRRGQPGQAGRRAAGRASLWCMLSASLGAFHRSLLARRRNTSTFHYLPSINIVPYQG